MRLRAYRRLFVAMTCLLAASALVVIGASPATAASGWVRLAHLSPDTPSVDVYLYSFGEPEAEIVLEHVGYGAVSPYQRLEAGRYTVAMRGEGADPDSPPVISTNVDVAAGRAYTVAGMGRTASLTIQVLEDSLSAPSGKASIRVIQASLQAPTVDVATDAGSLADELRFPDVTPYTAVDPGVTTVRVTGGSTSASLRVDLKPASTHTLVVVDRQPSGLELLDLTDAAGPGMTPTGGVNTGLGGMAGATSSSSNVPVTTWLALSFTTIGAAAMVAASWRRAATRADA